METLLALSCFSQGSVVVNSNTTNPKTFAGSFVAGGNENVEVRSYNHGLLFYAAVNKQQ